MGESTGFLPLKSQQPLIQLLVSLMTLLVISTLLLLLTLALSRLFFGAGMADFELTGELTPSQHLYLGFMQAMSQVSIFLVPGIVISWLMSGDISGWQGLRRRLTPGTVAIVIVLAITVIPLTTVSGNFNSQLLLPDWMSGIEDWMKGKEEEAMQLTSQLIYATNPWRLLINIALLAVIPAFGEELFFRGVLQQIFHNWFRSGVVAVVITALLFSTLHLQFYGFLPRFILGLVFGFLFLWSRSIWLPIIAHLVNNIVPVIVAYYMGWEEINSSLGERMPIGIYSLIIIVALPVAVMILIRDRYLGSSD